MKKFYIIGFLILMLFDTLAQISFKLASIHAMPLTFDVHWLIRVLGILGFMGLLLDI